jgi:hypothetical protein
MAIVLAKKLEFVPGMEASKSTNRSLIKNGLYVGGLLSGCSITIESFP